MPAVHLLIKGEVQGVFYRATAKKMADKLGLKGWVKNTRNGDVESTVSGGDKALQEFITWCKKGPEKAQVEDVIVTPAEEVTFNDFEIIRGR